MEVNIEKSWKLALAEEFNKPYFHQLAQFVKSAYKKHTVFPQGKEIFNAFDKCPLPATKVVVLGQDPYHGPGQAHGLSFSVREGTPFPPSLLNIFKELKSDLDLPIPSNGNLERWARQGVLLLNATLTVQAHMAGSHQNHGWEQFTDAVIKILSEQNEGLVFMLWGAYAQKKASIIQDDKHLKLKAPHPSPLSSHRGFFGCRHFSKANAYLESRGLTPIQW
ncbi:uracil-DNA glycosylase [Pleomorphovibrio marinus]|uniref:uracil-DNA glycosylase n=1 Tax=Pleomorphovibrio marinus TaxID=2164132 RepID=UPI000E0C805E|nr:uracil-DNA glycosylase [Pleomorphovibrio marinus]